MPTPTASPPKPIETEAFGRLFRSRLEARCAVFLEAMGLRWEKVYTETVPDAGVFVSTEPPARFRSKILAIATELEGHH